MKTFFICLCSLCMLVACGSDNDDMQMQMISAKNLAQTTWDVTRTEYNNDGDDVKLTRRYIVEFVTESYGRLIYLDDDGIPNYADTLKYRINNRIFTIFHNDWTIVKSTKNRFELQCYIPYKCTYVFTRKY